MTMNSDQRLTLLIALGASLALGVAIAGGIKVNRVLRARSRRHHHHDHEPALENWEGEGGNVPSVPTPVPAAAPSLATGS